MKMFECANGVLINPLNVTKCYIVATMRGPGVTYEFIHGEVSIEFELTLTRPK